MMAIDVLAVFRQKADHLYYCRLPDRQVLDRPSGDPIAPDEHYAVVRLAEMFLGTSRRLWRRFSPLVHSFVNTGGAADQHSVAGPGRLQDLGDTNLDRVIVLNQRVAGPIPYRGDELGVLCGLYSVPRADSVAALMNTLGAISELAGPQAAAAAKIADVVKSGVDSILGLGSTDLQLAVRDTFGAGGNPLRSGFHVAVGTSPNNVPAEELWLRDGRLHHGRSAALARPFTGNDYLVLQIERLDHRPDWAGLPGLMQYEARFSEVLRGAGNANAKRAELNAAWPQFRESLIGSPDLTRADAEYICTLVQADLEQRLTSLDAGGPFETRALDGGRVPGRADVVDFTLIDPSPEAFARVRAHPWI